MRTLHEPAADRQRRDVHRLGAQQMQAEHRARDVHDRIDGADLVEVHLVHAAAVHARLRLGQSPEDLHGRGHDGRRQPACFQDSHDVAQVPVHVMRARLDLDVDLGRAKRPPPHLARAQAPARQPQLRQLRPQRLERHADIDERAQNHVPRRATRAVEVNGLHRPK